MTTSVKAGHLATLQAGRGLAALAVVLYHANGTMALQKYFGENPAYWASSGHSGVHFFFVLSGLIIVLVHWQDIGSGSLPLRFWWRRARRLLPPLWAALTLAVIGQLLVFGQTESAWSMVRAFLVLPIAGEEVLSVEWTLRHEMLFYALFGVVIWNFMIGSTLMAVWIAASVLYGVFANSSNMILLSPYNMLFLFGCVAALVLMKGPPKVLRSPVWAIIGLTVFASTWIAEVWGFRAPVSVWVLSFGTGAVLAIVGTASLEQNNRLTPPKFLVFLGDASYSIYLVHFLAVSVLVKIAYKLDAIHHLPLLAWFALVVSASIGFGSAFYFGVERPLMRIVPSDPKLLLRGRDPTELKDVSP